MAASIAAALLVGAFAGWTLKPAVLLPAEQPFLTDALAAHRTFTVEVAHPVEVAATEDTLAPLSEATGGQTQWLAEGLPRIRRTEPDRPARGPGWIGLRQNGDFVVTGVSATTLLPGALVLALLLGLMSLGWWREAK